MVATQNVMRHYSVETTQKGADFIALAGCASMIVGTRVGAYNMRTRMEREEQKQSSAPGSMQGGNVHTIYPKPNDNDGGF